MRLQWLLYLLAFCAPVVESSAAPAWLRAEGTRIVDDRGQPVVLRGCNVGNWLLLEMWMLDHRELKDQHELESIFRDRFGADGRDRLMETYRASYITARDFELIRSFGFNVVRVPFEYRLLEDDEKPFTLKADAFRWLDRAVEWSAASGLYVILDLHGAPGRQSVDHTTGRAGENRLWSDPVCQERTLWLWKELASRYRSEPTVAMFDLVNEPFGDYRTARHQDALDGLVDRLHATIRATGARQMIAIPGTFQGIRFYGRPTERAWTNVVFTEHHYPGLFGSPPTLETHARFIGQHIPNLARYLEEIQTPYLVGEFNVVLEHLHAPALMRQYFDEYGRRGWAMTLWSYKLLRREGGIGPSFWGMVANRDPMPEVHFKESSFDAIDEFFRWTGETPYAVNEALRDQLTTDQPTAVPLKSYSMLHTPPHQHRLPGWETTDIGGSLQGGQRRLPDAGLEIYGGGADIWRDRDQFRFVWKPAEGDVQIAARVDSLSETHPHAKAGLMFRNGTNENDAHILLHVFPDGQILVGSRDRTGGFMREQSLGRVAFPVHVELRRAAGAVHARYSENGRDWKHVPIPSDLALEEKICAGLAVLAHDENRSLATAVFSEITFTP